MVLKFTNNCFQLIKKLALKIVLIIEDYNLQIVITSLFFNIYLSLLIYIFSSFEGYLLRREIYWFVKSKKTR